MFPDLLGKLPQVLSASRKPCNRILLLPPTCIPPASLYGHPSRYHHETPSITSRPVPESLGLPCISPASCPASCILVLSLLCPASPCVLLCSPVFSCVLLCSPAFSWVTLRLPSVPQTGMSPFPSMRLSSLVFRSSAPHSVIHSIPPFSLPFCVFSSEVTLSWDFLSPHPLFSPPFCKPPHQILHHSIIIIAAFRSIRSCFLEFSPFRRLEGSRLLFLFPFVSQL